MNRITNIWHLMCCLFQLVVGLWGSWVCCIHHPQYTTNFYDFIIFYYIIYTYTYIYVHLLIHMFFSYFVASGWCHCVHFCRCFIWSLGFLLLGLSPGEVWLVQAAILFEEPYHYLLPWLVILCDSHCVLCVRSFCLHILTTADFFLPVIVLFINMPMSMSHYLFVLWILNFLII